MKPGILMMTLGGVLAAGLGQAQAANGADALQPVDLRKVKVGGEIGRRINLTIEGNLLKLNPDQHIKPFVTRNTRGAEPFIGTGKTLDGMVRLAAYSGNPALIARKKQFVETLLANQEPDGYIGIMPRDVRTWQIYDVHDQAFVIQALFADYQLFGEKPSLEGARKLADYLIARWPGKPAGWTERIPGNEEIAFIGLDMAFLMMHRATGDKRYLDFLNALTINHMKVSEWDREIVQGRHGKCFGHIYAVLSHCQAQLHLYRLDPKPKLLATTLRAMDFLLARDGLAITGGAGHDECWSSEQRGTGNLGETCATAYQVFMYDDLMRMQGKAAWGDLIERTLYNAAFAAHSPDGRRIRYYTPFEGKRGYWGSDTYCCPGNFRRLIGRLPELVYYRAEGGGAVVNLYVASEATVGDGDEAIAIRQETDYPTSGKVAIHVAPAKSWKFPVLLRIPRWCDRPAVAINGRPVEGPVTPGEFLRLERTWQAGDQVTLDLPMKVRFIAGRKTQAGRAAVMRGPVVYTLNHKTHSQLAGVKLDRLVLLTDMAEVIPSAAVRPGGTACRIKVDLDKADKGAYTLTLTEFPDPDGQATYFLLPDMKAAVNDELLGNEVFTPGEKQPMSSNKVQFERDATLAPERLLRQVGKDAPASFSNVSSPHRFDVANRGSKHLMVAFQRSESHTVSPSVVRLAPGKRQTVELTARGDTNAFNLVYFVTQSPDPLVSHTGRYRGYSDGETVLCVPVSESTFAALQKRTATILQDSKALVTDKAMPAETYIYTPGPFYRHAGIFARDFLYQLEGAGRWTVTAEEVKRGVDFLALKQLTETRKVGKFTYPKGAIADHVYPDGQWSWGPGKFYGDSNGHFNRPSMDQAMCFITLGWHYGFKAGWDAAWQGWFRQKADRFADAWNSVPRNPKTGLVTQWTTPGHTAPAGIAETHGAAVMWGFHDSYGFGGDDVGVSVLACNAARALADMHERAGDAAKTREWETIANAMRDAIRAQFHKEGYLPWGVGPMSPELASPDITGYAVWSGILSDEQADAASDWFAARYLADKKARGAADLFHMAAPFRGAVRMARQADDVNPGKHVWPYMRDGKHWENLAYGYNAYQDGGYWYYMSLGVAVTLHRKYPDLAREWVGNAYADLAAADANPPYERIDGMKPVNNRYNASVGPLMGMGRPATVSTISISVGMK